LALFLNLPTYLFADDEAPTATPKCVIETESGLVEDGQYKGSAPIVAHFTSNVENLGVNTALYEWIIYETGKESAPYLKRFDENFDFTFVKKGASYIKLMVTFVNGTDTIGVYEQSEVFKVEVENSVLNVPNAFTPNGDGPNDVFKVKKDYKSIIEFKGYIFNRSGRKIFEWSDISKGWDGTYNGVEMPDGVYFCRIDAKGADGKVYKIRKAINLLRGFNAEGASGN